MNEILTALANDLGVFSEAEKAAKDRDTSRVQWRFLGDVLRHMTGQTPLNMLRLRAYIKPVIDGMDLLAERRRLSSAEWRPVDEVVDTLRSIARADGPVDPKGLASAALCAIRAADLSVLDEALMVVREAEYAAAHRACKATLNKWHLFCANTIEKGEVWPPCEGLGAARDAGRILERERQREALLRLIGECPMKGKNQ